MKVLIISRKNEDGYGGLSRFFAEFSSRYNDKFIISPKRFYNLFLVPFAKIDIIYLCDATLLPLGTILKAILKKPLFVTAHGLDLTFNNSFYQFLLRKTLQSVDSIILDSDPAKKLINKFNFPKERIFVINPGISTDHFKKIKDIKLPPLKDRIVLTTVGNLVHRKGHLWFIENVFKTLPDNFIYFIAGDGPERENLELRIKNLELKERVFLFGRLTHPQLSFVLKNTHIYVSPNQEQEKNFESFGIASGEAAALGLPVVASKVDGIPEAINHGKNGLLVNPDPLSFNDIITHLTSLKIRQEIGLRAKLFTQKHHSWEKTIQEYFKVFLAVSDKNQRYSLHTYSN